MEKSELTGEPGPGFGLFAKLVDGRVAIVDMRAHHSVIKPDHTLRAVNDRGVKLPADVILVRAAISEMSDRKHNAPEGNLHHCSRLGVNAQACVIIVNAKIVTNGIHLRIVINRNKRNSEARDDLVCPVLKAFASP